MARVIICFALLAALPDSGWAADSGGRSVAQADKAKAKSAADAAARSKPRNASTTEQQDAVFDFIGANHPELGEVLLALKQHRPAQYHRAVRDLYRTHQRLGQIRQRNDQARYDLELGLWKAQSRSQLLAARVRMTNEPELREQLRELLGEEAELRLQILKMDRQRQQQRLDRLNEQIQRLEQSRESGFDRQMRVLLNSGARRKPAADKPTAEKKRSGQQPRPRNAAKQS